MATTATTPSELLIAIDTTVRNQTTPNSITPITHSDLLYTVVEVLSANTYTTGGTYISSASTIDFSTNNGVNYNVDLSELDSVYLPLTGGTITGNINTDTLKIQTLGTGTSVTNLGVDVNGDVVSVITTSPYKVYTALLTQRETDNPTSLVLENTFGFNFDWVRQNSGEYTCTALQSNWSTENRLFFNVIDSVDDAEGEVGTPRGTWDIGDGLLFIFTRDSNSQTIDDVLSQTPIEIRVYNAE